MSNDSTELITPPVVSTDSISPTDDTTLVKSTVAAEASQPITLQRTASLEAPTLFQQTTPPTVHDNVHITANAKSKFVRISGKKVTKPGVLYRAHTENDKVGQWLPVTALPTQLVVNYVLDQFRRAQKRAALKS